MLSLQIKLLLCVQIEYFSRGVSYTSFAFSASGIFSIDRELLLVVRMDTTKMYSKIYLNNFQSLSSCTVNICILIQAHFTSFYSQRDEQNWKVYLLFFLFKINFNLIKKKCYWCVWNINSSCIKNETFYCANLINFIYWLIHLPICFQPVLFQPVLFQSVRLQAERWQALSKFCFGS